MVKPAQGGEHKRAGANGAEVRGTVRLISSSAPNSAPTFSFLAGLAFFSFFSALGLAAAC